MTPAYQRALDGIITACPSGVTHPNDFDRVVHIFKRLTDAGKFVSNPSVIEAYLVQQGMDQRQADKIRRIYEVFESAGCRNAGWSEKFIEEVLSS